MIIAVIGRTGQLARALQRKADERGVKVYAYERSECDLSNEPEVIKEFIRCLPSDVEGVIVAAAYTQVDQAETERDLAFSVNAAAPGAIGKACFDRGLPVVHISTDYVFSGTADKPYTPADPVNPVNFYGFTKLSGEQALIKSGARVIILRTSWVFDGTGKNFLTTMLRLSKTHDELTVVSDQIGRPTYAGHLAEAVLTALERICSDIKIGSEIFHVSGAGPVISWADFASAIFVTTGVSVLITPVETQDYPTPAARPKYSVLNLSGFENRFDIRLPDWQEGLKAALDERRLKDVIKGISNE